MVGMLRVIRRAAELVEVADRVPRRRLGREALGQGCRLLRHVEAVQPVEEGEAVAVAHELRLPLAPGLVQAARRPRLGEDDPRPPALPIGAGQHVRLGPLHVHLEEVDARRRMRLAQGGKGRDRQPDGAEAGPEGGRSLSMRRDGRREAVQPLDHMEVRLPGAASDERCHGDVARPHVRVKVGKIRLRLDREAAPALQVEPERDVVGDRVPRPDIDVEAVRLAGEDAGQVVILQVLCVGQFHHIASLYL
jgi:hypothetical protein